MKQSINSYDFHRAFEQLRPDNFSYDGLNVLFDYLEQYEEDTGEEIELDVIAICCDYAEMTFEEVYNDYIANGSNIYDKGAYDELQEIEQSWIESDRASASAKYMIKELIEDDQREYILEWLQERTQVITVDDTVIIQQF